MTLWKSLTFMIPLLTVANKNKQDETGFGHETPREGKYSKK